MYTQAGGPCTNYDCSLRNNAGYCKVTVCMNPQYNGWSNKEQAIGNSRNVSPDEIKKAVEQYRKQRMTNADRIRQMSDEELAQQFMDSYGYAPWCNMDSESWCENDSCKPCCEKWLKAPVEVDNNGT